MVGTEDQSHEHLEVYDTKAGLWHPERGDLSQPDGWDFLPAGDAFLTRRVKAAGEYWQLYQPKGRRAHRRLLGLLAPADAIAAARAAAEASLATRESQRAAGARQRAKSEAAYQAEFEQAVLVWLAFAPEHRYTDYDEHLERLEMAEFGLDDDLDIADVGDYREIKRLAHHAVDDFLERHRTPST